MDTLNIIKNNLNGTLQNIQNSSDMEGSNVKSIGNVFIGILFLLILFYILYRYRFTIKVKSRNSFYNGALLVSEPVEPNSNIKICTKDIEISQQGEHVYSFWMYVKDWHTSLNDRIIFKRNYDNGSILATISFDSPTLNIYIFDNILDTYDPKLLSKNENNFTRFKLEDIRLQTWNHIVIVQWGRNMDLYLNGKLVRSFITKTESITTDIGTFNIGSRNDLLTYNGLISRFKYYNYVIDANNIYTLYSHGPSNSKTNLLPVGKLGINVNVK